MMRLSSVSRFAPLTTRVGSGFNYNQKRFAWSSLLEGGGGIAAQDLEGGHTGERHVGKNLAYLLQRLETNPKLRAVSTFPDEKTADRSINKLILENQSEIQEWLKSREGKRFVLQGDSDEPTGIVLRQGSSETTEVNGIKVILDRKPEDLSDYVVKTAYPE